MLTVKNNDNQTFLIFFVFSIVLHLELEARLYYLYITITYIYLTCTDGLEQGTKMNFVVNGNSQTLKFDNFPVFQNVISNNLPPVSVMMTFAYENRYMTFP